MSAELLPAGSERLILAVVAILSATISVKVSGVQVLEILEFVLLFYTVIRIGKQSWKLTTNRALLELAAGYAVFLAGAIASAMLALTRPFYLAVGGLYQPGYITAARAAELLASVSAIIILVTVFRAQRSACLFTLRIFFWVGALSSALSVVAFGAYHGMHIASPFVSDGRASGFLNEGGPYGVYLVGVMASGWVLRGVSPREGRRWIAAAQVCNAFALILSASKAGVFAAVFLLICQALLSTGVRQRIATGLVMAVLVAVIVSVTDIWYGVAKYIAGGQLYETISLVRPRDTNFVIGRVAGLFLVPRMIAAHPWAGVGWGNYGLVRNNILYRGLSPVIGVTDSPGLGLYGLTAEIGIPLMLMLLWLLSRPVLLVHRHTRWRPLVTLALVQPVAHLCGAQLNLAYPWIVTALALGLAPGEDRPAQRALPGVPQAWNVSPNRGATPLPTAGA